VAEGWGAGKGLSGSKTFLDGERGENPRNKEGTKAQLGESSFKSDLSERKTVEKGGKLARGLTETEARRKGRGDSARERSIVKKRTS